MHVRRAAIAVLAAILVLPAAFIAGIYVFHPRSEAGFMAQLQRGDLPKEWAAFVDDHDQKFFVTEGDRACNWLSAQPVALMRTDPRYEPSALMERYLATTGEASAEWNEEESDVPARRMVATSAWNHLCEATLLIHRPYHPFGDPGDE